MKIVAYGLKENLRLWTYINFQEYHNAKLIDYKTNGNIIEYIIYEIEEVNTDYILSAGITYEIEDGADRSE